MTGSVKTISSVELSEIINEERKLLHKRPLRHDNLMVKIKNHPGIDAPNLQGVHRGANGEDRPCYYLPEREAHLMVMSESPGILAPKFLGQYKDSTGRMLKCYYLPEREAHLRQIAAANAIREAFRCL
jgi:hypothetical protein